MFSIFQNMVSRLRRKHLPEEVADLNLGDIVTSEDATWYSPTASNCFKPLNDLFILRTCYQDYKLEDAQHCWLAGLTTNRMLIRKKGTWAWHLVVGVIYETVVKTLEVDYLKGSHLTKQQNIFRNGKGIVWQTIICLNKQMNDKPKNKCWLDCDKLIDSGNREFMLSVFI
jgi:hypothetical protein